MNYGPTIDTLLRAERRGWKLASHELFNGGIHVVKFEGPGGQRVGSAGESMLSAVQSAFFNIVTHHWSEDTGFDKYALESPDYAFVFYRNALWIEKWNPGVRYRYLLQRLLRQHGKSITDYDVHDEDIAAGKIYGKQDGRIVFESLTKPEILEAAETALNEWAEADAGDGGFTWQS